MRQYFEVPPLALRSQASTIEEMLGPTEQAKDPAKERIRMAIELGPTSNTSIPEAELIFTSQ